MTRDPSDGSVREVRRRPKPLETKGLQASNPVLGAAASGLPFGSTKPEQQARLEKSREWLKGYRRDKTP